MSVINASPNELANRYLVKKFTFIVGYNTSSCHTILHHATRHHHKSNHADLTYYTILLITLASRGFMFRFVNEIPPKFMLTLLDDDFSTPRGDANISKLFSSFFTKILFV